MAFGPPFRDDPFFSDVSFPSMAFPDPFGSRSLVNQQRGFRGMHADPFQSILVPFGGPSLMRSMMADMQRMQSAMASGGGHSYSQSSVMHYSSGGPGQKPRIFQASSATRSGPGGVKETKKAMKDSETAVQKMSISHQIGDRSHTIEKKCNVRTREAEEHHSLINLDEGEVPGFNREWIGATRRYPHMLDMDHARHQTARRQGLPSARPYPQACPQKKEHDPFARERGSNAGPVAGQQRPRASSHSWRDHTYAPEQTQQFRRPSHSVDSLPRAKKSRVLIVD